MVNCFCKNCNYIIGKWINTCKDYSVSNYCKFTSSKCSDSIDFLDCKNCKKFVGIFCFKICINCFGKDVITGEKNLLNWIPKYRKSNTRKYYNNTKCSLCDNNENFRFQTWIFKELSFLK